MNTEDIITELETADANFEEWKFEHGLGDADGEWSGVSIALDAIRAWRKKAEAWKWVEEWETEGRPAWGWLCEIWDDEKQHWDGVELELAARWSVPIGEMPDDYWDDDSWSRLVTGCAETDWASIGDSETWGERLGVDWCSDGREPHPSGVWGGVVDGSAWRSGALWRVRKVRFVARPTEILKKYLARHPDLRLEMLPEEEEAGKVYATAE